MGSICSGEGNNRESTTEFNFKNLSYKISSRNQNPDGITVEQRKRGGKGTVNRNNQTSDTLLKSSTTRSNLAIPGLMKRESSQDYEGGFIYKNLLKPANEKWKHLAEFDIQYPASEDVIHSYKTLGEKEKTDTIVEKDYQVRSRLVSNPKFHINDQKSAYKAGIANYILKNININKYKEDNQYMMPEIIEGNEEGESPVAKKKTKKKKE